MFVDIINYVMFDLGWLSYVYDMVKFVGFLIVCCVIDGEMVMVFNGKIFMFISDMIVIVDVNEVYDIVGIMGGEYLGIVDDIIDVLFEIVYFMFEWIVKIGQMLVLISDVCMWFECGVDLVFFDDVVVILIGLIVEYCGGMFLEIVCVGMFLFEL